MTDTKASLQKRLATADRIIDLQKQEIARITTGEVRDIGRQKHELKRLKDESFRLNRDNNRPRKQDQSPKEFIADLQNRFHWVGFHLRQNQCPPLLLVAQQPAPALKTSTRLSQHQ